MKHKVKLSIIYLMISAVFISCKESVKVNDEFTIEHMEMFSSISLRNKNQGFIGNLTEAYWNKDSLVVSGGSGCFLIILHKTRYNDEMIEIDCKNLNMKLKTKPIKRYSIK